MLRCSSRFLFGFLLCFAAQLNISTVFAFENIALGQVAIELPEKIQVQSRFVTLNDIAVLVGRDIPTVKRLMSVPLGQAPVSGETVRLDRETLIRWIRRQTGLFGEQIIWRGASVVVVSVAKNDLSGDEIVKTAQVAIQEWLSPLSQRSDVQVAYVPQNVSLPVGKISLRARPLVGATLRKRMHVWVDIFVDDLFIRAIPVGFVVSAYAQVPVAKNELPAKAVINDEAVDFKEIDITTLRTAAFKHKELVSFANHRVRQTVRAGDTLSQRDMERLPAVQRGELAMLRAAAGVVALESRVEVLQDGYMGQMVRVKLLNATSSILARVTAPGQVEVQQ